METLPAGSSPEINPEPFPFFDMKTIDIEIAVAEYLNPRINLIVPNVFWGMFYHECDLLVVTKAGYAWEIEIKISLQDLKRDKFKRHGHKDHFGRIKHLYFAIPHFLEPHIEHIPDGAGIIVVNEKKRCRTIRKPRKNDYPYKFSAEEKYKIARLGALRLWGLKRKIVKLKGK